MKIISIIVSLFVSLIWTIITSQACYSKTSKIYRNMFIGRYFGNHDQTMLNKKVNNSPSLFNQKENELYNAHVSSIKNIWKKHQFLMNLAKARNIHLPLTKRSDLNQEIQKKIDEALETHQTGSLSHDELHVAFIDKIKRSDFPTHGLSDDEIYQIVFNNLEQTIKENLRDQHIDALEKILFNEFDQLIHFNKINSEKRAIKRMQKQTRFSSVDFKSLQKNRHAAELVKSVKYEHGNLEEILKTNPQEVKEILKQGYVSASVNFAKLCQSITNATLKLSMLANAKDTNKQTLAHIYQCNLNQEHHFLSILNIKNIIQSETQGNTDQWTQNLKSVFGTQAPNFLAALELRIQRLIKSIENHPSFKTKIVEWKKKSEIELYQLASRIAAEKMFITRRHKEYQRNNIK